MINTATIPEQLTERAQWVVWREHERDGKTTKVLYQPAHPQRKAAVNNPETWASFDDALKAYENAKNKLNGIGFVFTDDDPFVGIDLDKCIDEDGNLSEKADDIVRRMRSYTEVSPSGRGIHIIVNGTLKGLEGSRRDGVEMYESGRYFTVTGDRWANTNGVIAGEQKMLEAVHNLYVKAHEKPRKAVAKSPKVSVAQSEYQERLDALKASKWRALFEGDWSGYPSQSEGEMALCAKLAFYMAGDERFMDAAFHESGLMRDKWDEVHYADGRTHGQATIQKALSDWDGVTWSPAGKAVAIPAKFGVSEPLDRADYEATFLTQYANMQRLLEHFADRIAYTPGMGWYLYEYDTGVYVNDNGGHNVRRESMEALQQILRDELSQLAKLSADADKDDRKVYDRMIKALQSFIKTSASRVAIDAALELLKDNVLVDADTWDAKPFLFVCGNGVLNLETGALVPFDASYKATKRSRVAYDATAYHEGLNTLLELLTQDDRAETLQRALGSCLSGIAPNEKLFYLVGVGGTGKSTLMESVAACLGDYAANVDAGLLLEQRSGNQGARPELLRLRGARLAIAGELPKNGKLDAPQVKALTGRDTITARALYSNVHVSFEPVFKLFVHSNYDVKTEWDDTGIQRRLLRIPFNAKPAHTDPQLKLTLRDNPQAQAALLRWLVEGFDKWMLSDYDLQESEVIKQAIEDYHRENNPFYLFAEDCLAFGGDSFVSSKDLWDKYKLYCEANGERLRARRDLGTFMKAQGAYEGMSGESSKRIRGWHGVKILGVFG